jgi:hypothetical protein
MIGAAPGSSAVLGLNFTGSATVASLVIDGTAMGPGTYDASTNPSDIAGTGSLIVSAATPFQTWINGFPALSDPTQKDPDDDPDGDGSINLLEFALNGDPSNPSQNGRIVMSTDDSGDAGSDRDLTLTLAVRNGAVVGTGAGGSVTLTVDGIVYTIQGSETLGNWNKPVSEVVPAFPLVPAPDAGWTTRTFQVTDSNTLPGRRFMRVQVSN